MDELLAQAARMAQVGIRRLLVISGEAAWCEAQAMAFRHAADAEVLWVGPRTVAPPFCFPAKLTTLLGREFQHAIFDARDGFDASAFAALAGTLLQIKPILEGDEEGKIVMLSKVRGKKAGIEELVKLYDQMVEDRSAPVGISHAGSPADALVVATKLRQVGCTGEILTVCHEPVTGAHVGPGMLAVYFYSEIWR